MGNVIGKNGEKGSIRVEEWGEGGGTSEFESEIVSD